MTPNYLVLAIIFEVKKEKLGGDGVCPSVRPAICDQVSANKKLLLDFHKIRHNSSFKLVYQVKIPFTNKYTPFFL